MMGINYHYDKTSNSNYNQADKPLYTQFSYANILAHSNILPISQGLVHVSFSA